MARELKVYGWRGYRPGTIHGESREIVAAPSKAEAIRITGKEARRLISFSTTRDEDEIRIATANPGVVHWRDFDTLRNGWQQEAPALRGP